MTSWIQACPPTDAVPQNLISPAALAGRSWIKLFKLVDTDASGQLSFAEFVGLVRVQLGLPQSNVHEALLKAVWVARETRRESNRRDRRPPSLTG